MAVVEDPDEFVEQLVCSRRQDVDERPVRSGRLDHVGTLSNIATMLMTAALVSTDLDLDATPPKVTLAGSYNPVPDRYLQPGEPDADRSRPGATGYAHHPHPQQGRRQAA